MYVLLETSTCTTTTSFLRESLEWVGEQEPEIVLLNMKLQMYCESTSDCTVQSVMQSSNSTFLLFYTVQDTK